MDPLGFRLCKRTNLSIRIFGLLQSDGFNLLFLLLLSQKVKFATIPTEFGRLPRRLVVRSIYLLRYFSPMIECILRALRDIVTGSLLCNRDRPRSLPRKSLDLIGLCTAHRQKLACQFTIITLSAKISFLGTFLLSEFANQQVTTANFILCLCFPWPNILSAAIVGHSVH